jgi:hypothetical protein
MSFLDPVRSQLKNLDAARKRQTRFEKKRQRLIAQVSEVDGEISLLRLHIKRLISELPCNRTTP